MLIVCCGMWYGMFSYEPNHTNSYEIANFKMCFFPSCDLVGKPIIKVKVFLKTYVKFIQYDILKEQTFQVKYK